ncbi:MAG: agmatine deiminase family protein [Verrucomicrobiota bacterium]
MFQSLPPHLVDFSSYRMPAEWEAHEATWLAWPKNLETWPEHMDEARRTYLDIIQALVEYESVSLIVENIADTETIQLALSKRGISESKIRFFNYPYNDSWMRDAGPLFVVSPSASDPILANDFIFNAWGDKYQPWNADDVLPQKISKDLDIPVVCHDLVLEGGSIDLNGRGTLITTEQCLLNSNRNPSLSKSEIEGVLKKFLGIQRVLWLGEGIEGDDTDGHVDDITRFVDDTRVLTVLENSKSDPNYEPLKENWNRLKAMGDQDGNRLEVVDIPMPDRFLEGPFGRSPASYANFYIANRCVLVPTYAAPNEASVLSIFKDLFPDREIIPIDCVGLVCGLGSIHCITQQQPAV